MSETAPKDGKAMPAPMNPDGSGASERRAVPRPPGPTKPDEDLELVQLTQQGDRVAFRQLFDKYHRRVYAIAIGVVKQPADATDVAQEAFVKVFKNIGGFQGGSSFYTWLFRITMNLSLDVLRRRKTARQLDYDDSIGRDRDDVEEGGATTDAYLGGDPAKVQSRNELRANLERALASLPPHHQQAIILSEVDGLPYEEIAKIMDIPKGTVMSRVFYARRKLQAALAGYVNDESSPDPESEGADDASR